MHETEPNSHWRIACNADINHKRYDNPLGEVKSEFHFAPRNLK